MKKFKLIDSVLRNKYRTLEFFFLLKYLISCNFWSLYKLKINAFFRKKAALKTGRIRGVCIFTGRSGGVYRYLRASRFVLKGMDRVGVLPGIQRLSW